MISILVVLEEININNYYLFIMTRTSVQNSMSQYTQ